MWASLCSIGVLFLVTQGGESENVKKLGLAIKTYVNEPSVHHLIRPSSKQLLSSATVSRMRVLEDQPANQRAAWRGRRSTMYAAEAERQRAANQRFYLRYQRLRERWRRQRQKEQQQSKQQTRDTFNTYTYKHGHDTSRTSETQPEKQKQPIQVMNRQHHHGDHRSRPTSGAKSDSLTNYYRSMYDKQKESRSENENSNESGSLTHQHTNSEQTDYKVPYEKQQIQFQDSHRRRKEESQGKATESSNKQSLSTDRAEQWRLINQRRRDRISSRQARKQARLLRHRRLSTPNLATTQGPPQKGNKFSEVTTTRQSHTPSDFLNNRSHHIQTTEGIVAKNTNEDKFRATSTPKSTSTTSTSTTTTTTTTTTTSLAPSKNTTNAITDDLTTSPTKSKHRSHITAPTGFVSEITTVYPFISSTKALNYLSSYDTMVKPRRWPVKMILPEAKPADMRVSYEPSDPTDKVKGQSIVQSSSAKQSVQSTENSSHAPGQERGSEVVKSDFDIQDEEEGTPLLDSAEGSGDITDTTGSNQNSNKKSDTKEKNRVKKRRKKGRKRQRKERNGKSDPDRELRRRLRRLRRREERLRKRQERQRRKRLSMEAKTTVVSETPAWTETLSTSTDQSAFLKSSPASSGSDYESTSKEGKTSLPEIKIMTNPPVMVHAAVITVSTKPMSDDIPTSSTGEPVTMSQSQTDISSYKKEGNKETEMTKDKEKKTSKEEYITEVTEDQEPLPVKYSSEQNTGSKVAKEGLTSEEEAIPESPPEAENLKHSGSISAHSPASLSATSDVNVKPYFIQRYDINSHDKHTSADNSETQPAGHTSTDHVSMGSEDHTSSNHSPGLSRKHQQTPHTKYDKQKQHNLNPERRWSVSQEYWDNKEAAANEHPHDKYARYYRPDSQNNRKYSPVVSSWKVKTTKTTTDATTQNPVTTNSTPKLRQSVSSSAKRWRDRLKKLREKQRKSKYETEEKKDDRKSINNRRGSMAASWSTPSEPSSNSQSKTDTSDSKNSDKADDEKGPFIGYKTAYDFLSGQKKGRTPITLNENRRESNEMSRYMGEGMCEIFNKHYVPTLIGGKCA